MLNQFLEKTEFENYDDFFKNFKIKVPKNFNFGYDVVDALAAKSPDANALVWCNDNDEEKTFTFAEIKERSDKAAAYFKKIAVSVLSPYRYLVRSFHLTVHSGNAQTAFRACLGAFL